MYYSHDNESDKFLLFTVFLNEIISGKNEYSERVKAILTEANDLINHKKDFYSIDRDNYPITVFLSKNAVDFFKKVDLNNLSENNYKDLLRIFERQNIPFLV